MSQEDSRIVLEEFEQWRENRATERPDLSVAAYLKEREAEANGRRIEEAVSAYDRGLMEESFNAILEPTDFERGAFDMLCRLDDILIDDRPITETRTLGGHTERFIA